MSREIKFRGIFTSPNRVTSMVYGNYIKSFCDGKEYHKIEHSTFEDFRTYTVDPKTVGQYIGLKDEGVNEIYDGDILGFGDLVGIVKFSEQIPGHYIEYQQPPFRAIYTRRFNCTYGDGSNYIDDTVKVLGNIHQHPHLLK